MTIVSLTEEDKNLLAEWIAKEPSHEHGPDFYFESGTKSAIYEDEEGPVVVVRYSTALVLDMDFNPDAGKERIKKIMREGFPEVAAGAAKQGFKHLIFDSLSKPLISFCRAFGFKEFPDYRKSL
jgi:hypothetical protein